MSRIAPTFPSTQNTPNSISVTTASGFNQGDLVYYNNGDYKSQANLTAPGSVTIGAAQPQLILPGGSGGVGTPVFSNSDMRTSDNYGSTYGQAMAVLTNGNIVQVFQSYPTGYPSFRIVNSSGTIVVATTAISTSATFTSGYLSISVCALVGGGFAVMFLNNTPNAAYAVYTNTGTVTTAATTDAISGTTVQQYAAIQMTPLANGGFAVAATAANQNVYYKIYTSTGATTVAWTSLWSIGNNAYGFGIASRSDSSVCIIAYSSSATTMQYAIYSATGTSIVAATNVVASVGSTYLADVICLNNGTTFVLSYVDSGYNISAKLLPTGNTLGSSTQLLPYANTYRNSSSAWTLLRLFAQSGGGFALVSADTLAVYVSFYNSTITSSYPGTNGNGTVPISFPEYMTYFSTGINIANKGTVYENSGNLYFISTYAAYSGSGSNMNYISVNESTYAVNQNPNSTYTSLTSSTITTSQTPGSAVLSSATPTKLNYYASTNFSTTATQSPSKTYGVATISALASGQPYNLCSTTLTDGRVVVGYTISTSFYVTVLSASGAVLTTIFVGASVYGYNNYQSMSVFSLSNGKFGVSFPTNTTTLGMYIYSSSYNLVASSTSVPFGYTPATNTMNNDSYGYAVSGNTLNDHIAVLYSGPSSYVYLQVFDSSLSSVHARFVSAQTYCIMQIAATQNSGFMLSWQPSGGTYLYDVQYVQTGTNTYSSYGTASANYNYSNYVYKNQMKIVPSNGNIIYIPYGYSSGASMNVINYDPYSFQSMGATSMPSQTPSYNTLAGFIALGGTGYGTITLAAASVSSASASASILIYGGPNYTSMNLSTPASQTFTVSGVGIGSNPQFNVTPGPGYQSFVLWVDNSNVINYMIVNTCPLYVPYSITSGVTISNSVAISPNSSGSGITNAVLAGVANSTSSAGSNGSVTINGSTVLNSNYSASTALQSFDNQLPNGTGIQGVKGTIVGRNVNLFGNN